MSAKSPSVDLPSQTESAAARRALVAAKAAELFERDGYHSTNLAAIADAVGLRKPTLYHYFRSKEEILALIHDELIDLLIARQARRAELGLPVTQELAEIMRQNLSLLETHPGYLRVFFEHQRELSEARHAEIAKKRAEYQDMVRQVIVRGIESGELRPVNPSLVAFAMFGACNWSYQWFRQDGPLPSSDIANVFWDLFSRGLVGEDR